MLYVTTRDNRDAYTPSRVLRNNRAEDGGLYAPFRLPRLSSEEIAALGEKTFSQSVADTLNLFFNTELTSWDVEFAIGRYSVRLIQLRQRILLGECWHNPDWQFSRIAESLASLLRGDKKMDEPSADWATVGIRIAVIFGIFSELIRCGIAGQDRAVDVSVVSGDFSAPMSAWYAREMGLPIGTILCCCNENSAIWELFCHGQLRTDGVAVETTTPEADVVVPVGLERLIHAVAGHEEASRYVDCLRRGATYYVDDRLLQQLRRGIYVMVSSQRRVAETIPNVRKTDGCIFSPYCALAYAGLLDYRARTGERRYGLILGEKSPLRDAEMVADQLGISVNELVNLL